MIEYVHSLQSRITSTLETLEQSRFVHDTWTREQGGYGTSCVLQNGSIFEKAGVNISVIHSPVSPQLLTHMRARKNVGVSEDAMMFATGISMVLHPHNPHAPTVHLNYR